MEICDGPECEVDLEPLKASGELRRHATSCSAACRAAKSRAKTPSSAVARRTFWRGLATAKPARIETDARRRARAKGLTGRVPAPGPPE